MAAFEAAFAALAPEVLSLAVYRACNPLAFRTYGADGHPLCGVHRGRFGGRYNPPGSGSTLYCATSRHGAVLEVEQTALLTGLPPPRGNLDVLEVVIDGVPVLDLRDTKVLSALSLTAADLVHPTASWHHADAESDWPITQVLGAGARTVACGILVPSWLGTKVTSRYPLDNLVLFLDERPPWQPSRGAVRIVDPHGVYSIGP